MSKKEPFKVPLKHLQGFNMTPAVEEDKRHEVSDKMIETLKEVAYQQDDYGMDKYKKPLHHTMHYDWLAMAMEEEADKLKYLQNEMDRKNQVIDILEMALLIEHPKYLVSAALTILKTKGTGK